MFLLQVVHDGKEAHDFKDRVECAKASLPYIYSKAPTEVIQQIDSSLPSIQETEARIVELFVQNGGIPND